MPKRRRVLIVDDDKMIVELIQHALSGQGFDAICCENGEAALECVTRAFFDIIVVDYRMPGMCGAEITKLLKAQCPNTFIIGISGQNKIRDFLEAGADAFIQKPFLVKELISTINRLTGPPVDFISDNIGSGDYSFGWKVP